MNWVAFLDVLSGAFLIVAIIEGLKCIDMKHSAIRATIGWTSFFLATLFFSIAAGMGVK